MAVVLPARALGAVEAHARRRYPAECCGLLVGTSTAGVVRVEAALRARNLDPAPGRGYVVDPRALLRGHRAARRLGLGVVGYYHSHPDTPAVPSRRDVREALAGEAYLIVAVRRGEVAEVRLFRRLAGGSEGRMVEEALWVDEPAGPGLGRAVADAVERRHAMRGAP